MRKTLLVLGLAATVAAPSLAAPSLAWANCHARKTTGAVLGGLGGGAIGATAARGAAGLPWGFAAAGLGALTGYLIAGAGCHDHHWHSAYYRRAHYHRYAYYRREY